MNRSTTVLDALTTSELFEVLPTTEARTALVTTPEQLPRWESLNGDHRDVTEIVTSPRLRAGTTYWVEDPLHALVLREAARREGHAAEVLWDMGMAQHAVLVASAGA